MKKKKKEKEKKNYNNNSSINNFSISSQKSFKFQLVGQTHL